MWIWSLGWEDPLEEGMKTHSSVLAWRIPSTEEPGRPQSIGSHGVGQNWSIARMHTMKGLDLHHHQAPVRPPQVWCQWRPCGAGNSHPFPAVIKASSPLVRCPQRQIEELSPGRDETALLSHLHCWSSAGENHLKRKVSVRSRVSAEYNNAQVSIKICSL